MPPSRAYSLSMILPILLVLLLLPSFSPATSNYNPEDATQDSNQTTPSFSPPLEIPESHKEMADRIKAYYPWMVLKKECVLVGKESANYTETCWLLIWDDTQSRDVAAVMTIIEWDNYFSLEFTRIDGQDGDQLTIEIDGKITYENIFQRNDAQKGYWGIPINK